MSNCIQIDLRKQMASDKWHLIEVAAGAGNKTLAVGGSMPAAAAVAAAAENKMKDCH